MRTMYDSVSAWAIPADATLVAGYVDGFYKWSDADWARFPHAVKVGIAAHASTNAGIVGDMEMGDMTPDSLVGWVQMRRVAGVDPTGYCSEASWEAARAAFAAHKVAEPHWWIAGYPGEAVKGAALYPGSVGHQYADTGPHGENIDISVVADFWPGVDITTPPSSGVPLDIYWRNDTKGPGGAFPVRIMQGSTVLYEATGAADPTFGFPQDYLGFYAAQSAEVKAAMHPVLANATVWTALASAPSSSLPAFPHHATLTFSD